jgi:hypothetical protein
VKGKKETAKGREEISGQAAPEEGAVTMLLWNLESCVFATSLRWVQRVVTSEIMTPKTPKTPPELLYITL